MYGRKHTPRTFVPTKLKDREEIFSRIVVDMGIPSAISYIPLFYPKWPAESIKTDWQRRQICEALDEIESESRRVSLAHACFWVGDNPNPIFVLDRGREVFRHINWWSHDKPHECFEFCIVNNSHGYVCGLFPNLKKSSASIKLTQGSEIRFIPLLFEHRVVPNTFNNHHLPSGEVDVGIIDAALVTSDGGFDHDEACWIHNVPIDGSWAEYFERLLDK
jgi:hypothetical protein